jgi:hypothetical protein
MRAKAAREKREKPVGHIKMGKKRRKNLDVALDVTLKYSDVCGLPC